MSRSRAGRMQRKSQTSWAVSAFADRARRLLYKFNLGRAVVPEILPLPEPTRDEAIRVCSGDWSTLCGVEEQILPHARVRAVGFAQDDTPFS
jgi:hypothetical protein